MRTITTRLAIALALLAVPVAAFAQEMTAAGADWQLLAFGDTVHSFSNPGSTDRAAGTAYSAAADRRSWYALEGFLAELFGDAGRRR